jgi:hypothetical protein
MPNIDSYTVYNNATNEIVLTGTYVDVQDYIGNPDYTVVWDLNGYVVNE